MKTNIHRWDIAPKGIVRFYYVDKSSKVINIFFKDHRLNMETELEFILGYHKNHIGLIDKFKSNEYNVNVYNQNENDLYDEVLIGASYYVDRGNNIHLIK